MRDARELVRIDPRVLVSTVTHRAGGVGGEELKLDAAVGDRMAERAEQLAGAKLVASEARGKQMAFRFSRGAWLAVHLGMTGKLRTPFLPLSAR